MNLLKKRISLVSRQRHKFHLVTRSPWPLVASISALMITVGTVMMLQQYSGKSIVYSGFLLLFLVMFVWWRDVIRESTFLGYHTNVVVRGLRIGMVLFIVSEVMFFFSFFWAFFHSSLSPSVVLGSVWPPIGINILNPLHIPLLNTFILLISGVAVTLSHHSVCLDSSLIVPVKMLNFNLLSSRIQNQNFAITKDNLFEEREVNMFFISFGSLLLTILLAIQFTLWQLFEYSEALFYINDGIYGSTFYMTTGFHGFHVFVGTLFLIVSLFRMLDGHLLPQHHFGYEAAIWYWHFVDVVWLFLYVFVYCWSAGSVNLHF